MRSATRSILRCADGAADKLSCEWRAQVRGIVIQILKAGNSCHIARLHSAHAAHFFHYFDKTPEFAARSRDHIAIGEELYGRVESVAVRSTYGWYEAENWSHRVIAEKLNAYELILPDGSSCHFRPKRCLSQGGPRLITQSTAREILCRVFYTGPGLFYCTNDQRIKLKRRHISSIVLGQHPGLISLELLSIVRS